MTENFHFEDSDVLDVVVGTDYIKQKRSTHAARAPVCREMVSLPRHRAAC